MVTTDGVAQRRAIDRVYAHIASGTNAQAFASEFYRNDPRGTVLMFSTSQFISIVLAPLAVVMLIVLGRQQTPAPLAERKAA